ncbi:amidase [Pandoraea cepalis]|uniref:Glutamyl-tRNA(Gln) amidotransferase subunit A n=1 Tax=Pandoraea cepalis TaxID=2508294 RepID=A0A5E4VMI3_9BURK|nr:Glutamyl-tRNA(Gln) amidotransferase subunit A [Pandoraea cepalis]
MSVLQMSLREVSLALTDREISSVELMDAVLDRAEAVGTTLNAFLHIDRSAACAAARVADADRFAGRIKGPLHGVPMAHKDMFFRAGVRSSCGSAIPMPLADRTATVLSRLDAAGAIQFGVLNMAEFAVGGSGHNKTFGHCRNPWNTERISGGSSSGSAASVAARANFAALGSDTGGSIRTPASVCGVTGLRPSFGRVSRAGVMGLSPTLDTVGPLARTAYDCAMVMNAIAGIDADDPTTAAASAADFLHGIDDSIRGLRVGVPTNYYSDAVDPAIRHILDESLRELQELNCVVTPIELPDVKAIDAAAAIVFATEGAALHAAQLRAHGEMYTDQVVARLERGFVIPAPTYLNAVRYRAVAAKEFMQRVFSQVDVIHIPVLPIPTPTITETDVGGGDKIDDMLGKLVGLTRPISYLGFPALSVPAGFTKDGMPVGMQLVGRPNAEATLLRIGHSFQGATDWHKRAPNIP